MNETIFFFHVLLVFLFALGAVKLGKEALIAWICLQAVLANLFVIKQISFFGFNITCSDVFAIGSILSLNLLREYFSQEAASKALKICLFCMLFFVAMAQLHLSYQASIYDTSDSAYKIILCQSPRLLCASIAVFFFVQKIDLLLFHWLKQRNIPLFIRNGFSLSASQLLDTVLFTCLGLWGIIDSLLDIMLVSFVIKLLIIALLNPVTALIRRWIHLPTEAT